MASKVLYNKFENSHIENSIDGKYHSISLNSCGNVYVSNRIQDGDINVNNCKKMKLNLPPIKQIVYGCDSYIFVSCSGDIYICTSKKKEFEVPLINVDISNVDFVVCGNNYTICKNLDNSVYLWGNNYNGELGFDNPTIVTKPIKCETWPGNIVDIKCGRSHTLVLTANQEVFSCGSNYYGELGRTTKDYSASLEKISGLPNIKRIECGDNHSLCIDNNDNLYVFGNNGDGQLGLEEEYFKVYNPIKHPSLSNVIDISTGRNHTFIKTSKNEIFGFGNNEFEQLGIDTEDEYQFKPVQIIQERERIWSSNRRSLILHNPACIKAKTLQEKVSKLQNNENDCNTYNRLYIGIFCK